MSLIHQQSFNVFSSVVVWKVFFLTLYIPTWRRRVQRRVCAFTGYSAVLPGRNKLGWSCAPYVMNLNEVAVVKTGGRPIMWQTGCLSLLPSVISQVPCQIQAFLQTFSSYFSVTFGCTWWEVLTIASSVVAIRLTARRLMSPGKTISRRDISNQRAFDFCDESGKEKDPPGCWLTSLTRLYNPRELKLIQEACFRGTKNDSHKLTATKWILRSWGIVPVWGENSCSIEHLHFRFFFFGNLKFKTFRW